MEEAVEREILRHWSPLFQLNVQFLISKVLRAAVVRVSDQAEPEGEYSHIRWASRPVVLRDPPPTAVT